MPMTNTFLWLRSQVLLLVHLHPRAMLKGIPPPHNVTGEYHAHNLMCRGTLTNKSGRDLADFAHHKLYAY